MKVVFARLHFQGGLIIALGMKPRILFVDDEAATLEALALYFRDRGCEVATAGTGSQAMKLADEATFDLAVFDINLAGENGMELLGVFKTNFPELPVVLLTGLPENDELAEQALARGASGFMVKADSLENLFAALHCYLPAG